MTMDLQTQLRQWQGICTRFLISIDTFLLQYTIQVEEGADLIMSESDNNKQKEKRKRSQYHERKKPKYQPKRGGPGILLSCETGREKKCLREGLEIINFYFKGMDKEEKEKGGVTDDNTRTQEEGGKKEVAAPDASTCATETKHKPLSLDDELAQLQSKNKASGYKHQNLAHNGPFAVYETGCRGTVFVLCTLPNCSLIPKVVKKQIDNGEEDNEDHGADKGKNDTEPTAKKQKSEQDNDAAKEEGTADETCANSDPAGNVSAAAYDPTETVRRVIDDIQQEITNKSSHKRNIPGSRFIMRMIPIQATCYASIDEITVTFRALLDRLLQTLDQTDDKKDSDEDKSPKTFSVVFKKRLCGNVHRDQVIEAIVEQVNKATSKSWKVNLSKPDYRCQVEICKTLCGISIIAAGKEDFIMSSHNFNLADLRTDAAEARNE
jgi:tRNA acetyltransferase TAN1